MAGRGPVSRPGSVWARAGGAWQPVQPEQLEAHKALWQSPADITPESTAEGPDTGVSWSW